MTSSNDQTHKKKVCQRKDGVIKEVNINNYEIKFSRFKIKKTKKNLSFDTRNIN